MSLLIHLQFTSSLVVMRRGGVAVQSATSVWDKMHLLSGKEMGLSVSSSQSLSIK